VILIYLYTLKLLRMITLIGVYECRVDEKGRLMLPAAYKKQLAHHADQGFVIKRSVFHKCLELYPHAEWVKESSVVSSLNRFVKKNADFIRIFMDGVKTLELDTAGRLLIPKEHTLYAGIGKDVVLTSSVNRIEIWDKARYYRFIEEGAAVFADLAEEVMGQQNHPSSAPTDVP
jgi:MraZ protein